VKKLSLFFTVFLAFLYVNVNAQIADCNLFCVMDIQMETDSTNLNMLNVTIYNGDSIFINYPFVDLIIDDNGDTIAKCIPPFCTFFGHSGNTIQIYPIPTIFDSVPTNFSCTVFLRYNLIDTTCVLPYPCTTTGINDNYFTNTQDNIKIFPNPFSASTTIEFANKKNEKYSLLIYNTTGQLVRKIDNISNGKIRIERDNLTNGLYFFQLRTDSEIIGKGKVIIITP